jgi:hypothetical protein
MFRIGSLGAGMNAHRLRNVAGLASAVVPFAVAVHLIAEGAALGREGFGFGFVVRHAYFAGLLLVAAWWFCATVGIGRPAAERRRRCAMLRADLLDVGGVRGLLTLAGAQIAFFGVTQAVEGVPIASGAVVLALGVALAGSLLCAALVFLFARSIVVAGLDSVIGVAPLRPAARALARRERTIAIPRRATSAFSLFIPNRPPPILSRS